MIAKPKNGIPIETSAARFFWRDAGNAVRMIEIEVVPSHEGRGARVHVSGSSGTEFVFIEAFDFSHKPGTGGPGAVHSTRETPGRVLNSEADPWGSADKEVSQWAQHKR